MPEDQEDQLEQRIQKRCLALAKDLLKVDKGITLPASLANRAFRNDSLVQQSRDTYEWLRAQKQFSQDEAWELSGMQSLVHRQS